MVLSYFEAIASKRKRVRQAPKRRPRFARPRLEGLEDRVVPSLTADLAQGILSLHADDNPNRVQVLPSNQGVQVLESDQLVGTYPADQVQLIAFQYGAGQDSFDNETAIPDKQLRLSNSGPLTPAQLSQTGHLDALLVGNTLTLAGPSGAGFQITGDWAAATTTGNAGTSHTFTASGLVTLSSALGDLPMLVSSTDPLTITTAPGTQPANFGAVASIHWDSGSPLDTTDPNSALSTLSRLFGLQVTSDSPQFGVALGSDLHGLGAPLNNALPYLYFTTPNSQAQFGAVPAAVGPANLLTVAFDPEDPFLYARTNEFAVGVSLKGYIPFTPNLSLPGLDTDPLYGHLYGKGPVALGDVPATVSGEAVLNLDAQHDGVLLGAVVGDIASYVVTGQLNLSDLAQTAPGDLRVGLNGHADIHYTQGGFNLDLPVDASAEYTPGRLLVHGTSTGNLFGGTPLSFLGTNGTLDLTADVNTQGLGIVTTSGTSTVAGFTGSGLTVVLNDQGVSATADLQLQYPSWSAHVGVTGSVLPGGQYSLGGTAQAQFAGFGSGNVHFVLTNSGLSVGGDVSVPIGAQTATVHFSSDGYVHADGQFNLTGHAQATFAGFTLPDATFVLSNSGLTAQGTVTGPVATGSVVIPFTGYIHTDGQFNVSGDAQGTFSSFTIPNAHYVLNNSGLTVSGDVNVHLGPVTVPVHFTSVGYVLPNGQFNLDGHAQATFAGFVSADADFVLNNSGLTANGNVGFQLGPVGYSVPFTGWVHTDGQYQLTATVAQLNFAGFGGTGVFLTLNNAGLTATASFQLGSVVTASLTGTIYTNGQFSLTYTNHVAFAGFGADTTFTLTTGGVAVSAGVTVPYVGNVRMGGSLFTNGQYQLNFSGGLGINGFGGNGWLRLDNTGITAHLDVGLSVLGLQAHLDGYVRSNGQFQLTAHAGLNLGPISGSLDFTLNNSGFMAHAAAGIDLRTTVHGPFGASLTVGFRVGVDVSFAIDTNGTFYASGNFTATAYLGLSLSVGIGFSLDNHTFTIHTHDIGFTVWFISFHPFDDIVVHY
jgi:hypothetical protein